MALGLIGTKVGMTRVFTEDGRSQPVTVVEVIPNRVTQIKRLEVDGYSALQVTTGSRRPGRVTRPLAGHFAKAKVEPGHGLWEFRADPEQCTDYELGAELNVNLFKEGEKIDVRGTTIGKGFAGVIKRHGFRGGRATHGNSKAHRKAGSIGQNQDPGRVFPGKKMAGHMGNEQRVQQGLRVVRIDNERNLILVSGSIPGPKGQNVIIQSSVKVAATDNAPE